MNDKLDEAAQAANAVVQEEGPKALTWAEKPVTIPRWGLALILLLEAVVLFSGQRL